MKPSETAALIAFESKKSLRNQHQSRWWWLQTLGYTLLGWALVLSLGVMVVLAIDAVWHHVGGR